ncbi:DNA-binding transcriptional activator UhpA [Enterobacter cancerogenus]|uniref:DNA-binding transcriptional activator UhpA n=1 Tax=Enterobacter cancerogenus TaxID=69218 RepID=A0A484WWH6_9ENTR|nr:DNA-binding transcriptional activator UhpA [Enterobacter cancerogenus]
MITIALIDDHLIVRSGFAQLLSLEPDFQVVAEFGSGREALAVCRDAACRSVSAISPCRTFPGWSC